MVTATRNMDPPVRVRVVVTCSHRKTRPVPTSHRLRHVTGAQAGTRLKNWTKRLTDETSTTTPALSLYAGEHWDVARRLGTCRLAACRVELWVCSAGYGLIPVEAPISPYSATFAPGHPDSVPNGRAGAGTWWAALREWSGPVFGPRSLAQLAAVDREARLLLVLSRPYLNACRDDVLAAASIVASAGGLSIVSAGTKSDSQLEDLLLPVDARLQHALGGTRRSLNVRVAEHLLAGGLTTHEEMKTSLERLLVSQPPVPRYERLVMTDRQVGGFIRQRLRIDRSVSCTRLLRELRESGHACEQRRFSALFHSEAARSQ